MTSVHSRASLPRGLVRACHPEPTAAVTAVAMALAVAVGRSTAGVLAVGAAVLAGQLSVGWQNDYLDRFRDAAAGRAAKPVATGVVPPRVLAVAVAAAGAAVVPLSLLSGLVPGLLHVAAVGSAWTYNLWLKSTVFSVLPYAVSFGLLPAFVVTGLPGHPAPPVWLVLAGSLLGAAAHFANVLPDFEADARTGVRGLPQRVGERGTRLLAAVLLLATAAVLAASDVAAWIGAGAFGATLLVGGGGLWWGRRAGSAGTQVAFFSVLVVALVDVALLLTAGNTLR